MERIITHQIRYNPFDPLNPRCHSMQTQEAIPSGTTSVPLPHVVLQFKAQTSVHYILAITAFHKYSGIL